MEYLLGINNKETMSLLTQCRPSIALYKDPPYSHSSSHHPPPPPPKKRQRKERQQNLSTNNNKQNEQGNSFDLHNGI